MLASPSLIATAGAGLTGGGSVPLGGTTTLSLAAQQMRRRQRRHGPPIHLLGHPVTMSIYHTFVITLAWKD
jgi:hypothetical protein